MKNIVQARNKWQLNDMNLKMWMMGISLQLVAKILTVGRAELSLIFKQRATMNLCPVE